MKGFMRKKIVLIVLVIIIVAGAGSYFFLFKNNETLGKAATENIVTVTKGNLRSSVSGTSQFEPKNMQIITIPSEGTIKTMNLTRNKNVKKDEVLFEISNPDYNINLQKAQLTLSQLQKDYDDLNNQLNSLTITAPISGKLTLANNLDIASQISKTSKIATISVLSKLKVTLPFLLEDASQFKAGDTIDLEIDGFMLTKTATIKTVSKKPHADASGNKSLDVDIEVNNEDTLDAGLMVQGSVTINGYTSMSQGKAALQYTKTLTLTAKANGNIQSLNFKNGDQVEQGDVIATIANDTLQNDISVKKATIDQQQVTIEDMQDKIDSLIVKAPFDGLFSTDFVNQKSNVLSSFPVGTKVSVGGQLGGVASLDSMQLPIQVDELDLPSIKDKMTAEVKVDSLAGRTFKGEVNQISTVGTTTNGVTFYTVVLSVGNANQILKYGMTATSEILIQNKENVLVLPIEAMQSQQGKRYVSLKKADGTTELKHEIKIGIRTKTQIEVLEGLKEGDKVVTPILQRRQGQTLSTDDIDALRKQFEQNGGPPAGFGGGGGGGFGGGAGGPGGPGGPG